MWVCVGCCKKYYNLLTCLMMRFSFGALVHFIHAFTMDEKYEETITRRQMNEWIERMNEWMNIHGWKTYCVLCNVRRICLQVYECVSESVFVCVCILYMCGPHAMALIAIGTQLFFLLKIFHVTLCARYIYIWCEICVVILYIDILCVFFLLSKKNIYQKHKKAKIFIHKLFEKKEVIKYLK